MFEKVYIYRRVVGNADPMIAAKYKERIRRTIIGIRSLRFAGGNPLVFSDYAHDFWFDPSTNYIPEEHIDVAKKEIDFHVMTMVITESQYYGIMRVHQKRGHSGRWSAISNMDRNPGDPTASPHTFLFESPTDFIEFRLLYEHEIVEAA